MIALALWLVSLVLVGYTVVIAAYLAVFVVLGIFALISAPLVAVGSLVVLGYDAGRRLTGPRPEAAWAPRLGRRRYRAPLDWLH